MHAAAAAIKIFKFTTIIGKILSDVMFLHIIGGNFRVYKSPEAGQGYYMCLIEKLEGIEFSL